ncbi:hypothetical protein NXU85_00100 [Phocaeicola vulgatus]|nr:hypothetical protein [Phocaeicola vulgatus]
MDYCHGIMIFRVLVLGDSVLLAQVVVADSFNLITERAVQDRIYDTLRMILIYVIISQMSDEDKHVMDIFNIYVIL